MNDSCPLCTSNSQPFAVKRKLTYLKCQVCGSVFMSRSCLPSLETELRRYQKHQNNPQDERFLQFLTPLFQAIKADFGQTIARPSCGAIGLDFGSGPTPVLAEMLQKEGFNVVLFDPFFAQNHEAIAEGKEYSFIIVSEVAEHFFSPKSDWQTLRKLLKQGKENKIYVYTEILTGSKANSIQEFQQWGYSNDFTHVFFYSPLSFDWICKNFGFSSVSIHDRLIIFEG